MPQRDKLTYFTPFFWSCLFFFTFYIPICNDGDGVLGISRILRLRNQLVSHRGNKIRSNDPNWLYSVWRERTEKTPIAKSLESVSGAKLLDCKEEEWRRRQSSRIVKPLFTRWRIKRKKESRSKATRPRGRGANLSFIFNSFAVKEGRVNELATEWTYFPSEIREGNRGEGAKPLYWLYCVWITHNNWRESKVIELLFHFLSLPFKKVPVQGKEWKLEGLNMRGQEFTIQSSQSGNRVKEFNQVCSVVIEFTEWKSERRESQWISGFTS